MGQAPDPARAAGRPREAAGGRPPDEGDGLSPGPDLEPEVTPFWRDLGLPGLFDVHVHFMPDTLQQRVWAYFDAVGPKIGREWPIRYRDGIDQRVDRLRAFGVRRFGALSYAHRPGVAAGLNEWAADFAATVPEALHCATLFPEPETSGYVADAIDAGAELFKVHAQVGEFRLDDPMLAGAWGALEDTGTPVVLHIGSGPVGNRFTGPDHLRRLLVEHPRLRVVVAHLGAPEYAEFLDLAERYDETRLDTTMVFTDFFEEHGTYPGELLPRLADLGDKVLLGSDFPTIPYPYRHQLDSLARLHDRHPRLDESWLRKVCWDNAVRLFGAPPVT